MCLIAFPAVMAGLDPAIQNFWARGRSPLDGAHTLPLCAKGGRDEVGNWRNQ